MKVKESFFKLILASLTLVSSFLLFLIMFFIFKESLEFFRLVDLRRFLFGREWNPIANPIKLSIGPIVLATIYLSLLAIFLALPIGLGFSICTSIYLKPPFKKLVKVFLDIVVSIPSIVYGFMGLLIIVKYFEETLGMSSGESVLAGGIVLSIMILPYIIYNTVDTMDKVNQRYRQESDALGLSTGYYIRNILLKESRRGILSGVILAFARAMGETMAVMMVIGNTPIMPRLFGKCQTISSLIALEMGMVEVGSIHYHGLFAAGFILMLILIVINIIFHKIKKNIEL